MSAWALRLGTWHWHTAQPSKWQSALAWHHTGLNTTDLGNAEQWASLHVWVQHFTTITPPSQAHTVTAHPPQPAQWYHRVGKQQQLPKRRTASGMQAHRFLGTVTAGRRRQVAFR